MVFVSHVTLLSHSCHTSHVTLLTLYLQVPQYILEEAISSGQGGSTSIIVTQPRRISALGLAQRVAQERGEEVRARLLIVDGHEHEHG
jgi:hypothetical protein